VHSQEDLLKFKETDPQNIDFWDKHIAIITSLKENYNIKTPIFAGPISNQDPKKAKATIRTPGKSYKIVIRHFPEYTVFNILS